MADPAIYCLAGAKWLCMTQSEWAAWTQAALTCVTFAISLITQHLTNSRAARQKEASDAALMAEKVNAANERRTYAENLLAREHAEAILKARATAIFILPELFNFESALEAILQHGPADTPAEAFNALLPSLTIRNRSLEALQIPEATSDLLLATDAAHTLHNYLRACKDAETFGEEQDRFINQLAESTLPKVMVARAAIEAIAKGRAAPSL